MTLLNLRQDQYDGKIVYEQPLLVDIHFTYARSKNVFLLRYMCKNTVLYKSSLFCLTRHIFLL